MTTLDPTTTLSVTFPIVIRQVEESDLANLEMDGAFLKFRRLFRRSFREQQQGKRLMLIADCNGVPIARIFALWESDDKTIADGKTRGYLYSFFVQSPFRGQGIGSQLVAQAESEMLERGLQFATIAVSRENTGALKLYQRLGYYFMREDEGKWSYNDHEGKTHHITDPCWILEKSLKTR
jgi:ribosomal protein S18 acetylase RimI-like enzyme